MSSWKFSAPKVPAPWRQVHDETCQRISLYLGELDRLAASLAEAGIPLVVLKNGGIARGIFPCPGCCPMGDLDVLVEKRHFRRAHELLLDRKAITSNFAALWKRPRWRRRNEAAGQNTGKSYPGGKALAGVAMAAGGRPVDSAGPGA